MLSRLISAIVAVFCLLALTFIPTTIRAEPLFNHVVTEATLAATVSYSSVQFDHGSFISNYGGNVISGEAFQNAVGIIAVVQNTGMNSNVQQAVTFHADSIDID